MADVKKQTQLTDKEQISSLKDGIIDLSQQIDGLHQQIKDMANISDKDNDTITKLEQEILLLQQVKGENSGSELSINPDQLFLAMAPQIRVAHAKTDTENVLRAIDEIVKVLGRS